MIGNKLLAFLDDKYNLAFITFLIIGIYLRLKFLFIESIWHDEASYMWQMQQLFNPAYISSTRIQEPFALVIMRIYSIVFEPFIAGRLMGLTFGVAGLVLIYFLGSEVRNKFVGLSAMLLLTFHHVFWYLTEKALLDVPITTMFILVAYVVVKLEKDEKPFFIQQFPEWIKTNFWSILLGIVLLATMLTKRSGILALVFVGIYFVLTRRLKWDKKAIYSLSIPISFLVVGSIIYYILFQKLILRTFFLYLFDVRSINQPFNYINLLPSLFSTYVLLFFVIGMIFSFIYRKKTDILLLSWFWTVLVFFSISIGGNALPRYILPLVPVAFIFTAIVMSELRIYLKSLFKLNIPRVVFLILVILLCIPMFQQGTTLNVQKADSYIGFREAGEWLSDNIPEDAIIYVGSPAAIRIFSGFEYVNEDYSANFGSPDGKIYYSIPKDVRVFEDMVLSQTKQVYLELDIWEYANQGWAYPLSQEKFEYLQSIGFVPVKVVERTLQTPEGPRLVPVIFIFKLNI
jgi:4-amino-4-deoxy-L-arabinose transferase-like glycosyltransferase